MNQRRGKKEKNLDRRVGNGFTTVYSHWLHLRYTYPVMKIHCMHYLSIKPKTEVTNEITKFVQLTAKIDYY
nr:hypothetical protein CFP56_38207 [Quercus suber]